MTEAEARTRRRSGRRRFARSDWREPPADRTTNARYGLVLLLLLASFLLGGLGTDTGDRVVAVLTIVLVVATFRLTAVTTHLSSFTVLMVLAVLALIGGAATDPGDGGRAVAYLALFFLHAGLGVALLLGVVRRPLVDAQTIMGAIGTYVLIGLSFSWLYAAVAVWDPDQFTIDPTDTAEFSVFSFVTLTTVGFGNDYPTGALGGRLTVLQALLAQLFLAIFIARMVGLYGRERSKLLVRRVPAGAPDTPDEVDPRDVRPDDVDAAPVDRDDLDPDGLDRDDADATPVADDDAGPDDRRG